MDHCGARTRRADDGVAVRVFKDLNEPLSQTAGFPAISRVEGGLTTTGLTLVENDFAPGLTQHGNGTGADRRPQLVNQTSNEEGDPHIISEPGAVATGSMI